MNAGLRIHVVSVTADYVISFPLKGPQLQMERKKASDFPQELLNLFDHYVHGEIDRRSFLDGAKKFAGVGSATAIWESLRPNYAWAQQVPQR
jgi:hypothetical protein